MPAGLPVSIDPSAETTFVFLDVNAKLAWDVTPAHQLTLVAIAGRMDVEERDNDSRVNVLDQGLNESALLLTTWRWQATPRLRVTQQASALYNRFRNLNPFGEELGRGRSSRGRLSWRGQLDGQPTVLVEAGASLDVQRKDLALSGAARALHWSR